MEPLGTGAALGGKLRSGLPLPPRSPPGAGLRGRGEAGSAGAALRALRGTGCPRGEGATGAPGPRPAGRVGPRVRWRNAGVSARPRCGRGGRAGAVAPRSLPRGTGPGAGGARSPGAAPALAAPGRAAPGLREAEGGGVLRGVKKNRARVILLISIYFYYFILKKSELPGGAGRVRPAGRSARPGTRRYLWRRAAFICI